MKESLIAEFRNIVGDDRLFTSPEALKSYSYDGTTNWIHEPEVVLCNSLALRDIFFI